VKKFLVATLGTLAIASCQRNRGEVSAHSVDSADTPAPAERANPKSVGVGGSCDPNCAHGDSKYCTIATDEVGRLITAIRDEALKCGSGKGTPAQRRIRIRFRVGARGDITITEASTDAGNPSELLSCIASSASSLRASICPDSINKDFEFEL